MLILAILGHWFFWSGCLAHPDTFWGESKKQLRKCHFASTPELVVSTKELAKNLSQPEIKKLKKLVILTGDPRVVSKLLNCIVFKDVPFFTVLDNRWNGGALKFRSRLASLLENPSSDVCSQIHRLLRIFRFPYTTGFSVDVMTTEELIQLAISNVSSESVSEKWLLDDASGQRAVYYLLNSGNFLAVSATVRELLTD